MAISDKEAALRMIEQLPDDATLDDIMYAMYVRQQIERGLRDVEAGNTVSHEDVMREMDEWRQRPRQLGDAQSANDTASDEGEPITFHLEQKGYATVIVPDRPLPPLTVETVNNLIEEIRRERAEHVWGGPLPDDAGR